jgi:2-dehydro-3-deoxy-D-arabinonate dehydratase
MSSAPQLVRFFEPGLGVRLGVRLDDNIHDVTETIGSVSAWLNSSSGKADTAIATLLSAAEAATRRLSAASLDVQPAPDRAHWLSPVDGQEVWAAGVTYERSREARQIEAVDGGDIYARVYRADRPELFFKARGSTVVGPYGQVGIRADSAWNVPEPELALVINPAMEVVGVTVGNDMSSRDIEGANPLYLPQAKVYTASCALGPGIVLGAVKEWPETAIHLRIERSSKAAFEGEIHTRKIHRGLAELVSYLGRSHDYPEGVVLLTGTGIVPPNDFTLAAGDTVQITIDAVGTLINTVQVV